MRAFHKALIISATTSLGLLASQAGASAQIGTPRTGCTRDSVPGPEEVITYVDDNFGGDCRILSVGVYPFGDGLPNDSITSIKIGSNVQAHLFWEGLFDVSRNDTDFVAHALRIGGGETRSNDIPNLAIFQNEDATEPGWSDAVSSLRVILKSNDCRPPGPRQAVFYQHAGFTGDCVTKDVGSYDIWDIGMANDSITSLKVGNAVDLTVCKNAGFGPPCDVYSRGSEIGNLGDDAPVGNDSISSVDIR